MPALQPSNTDSESMRKIPRVGITGGIGSGKSTVCRIFHQAFGIPIYYADIEAKGLLNTDPNLRAGIEAIFGPEAYTDSGLYNRTFVAKIAFSAPDKLAALNALVHPAVEIHSRLWHEKQAAHGAAYTLKEAALLVESKAYLQLDFMMVVTAAEAIRIQRVMDRDGLSAGEVQARLRGQLPEAEKVNLADFVIVNDGSRLLLPQVWEAHQAIMHL